MPSRVFFKIGTGNSAYDLTPFLDIQDFSINQEEVYAEWTDGNYNIHRNIMRTQMKGTVTVGFSSSTDYETFLANMETLKTSQGNFYGFYNVESWVCNMGSASGTQTYRAYITPVGSAKWDLVNGRLWITQELTVLEV